MKIKILVEIDNVLYTDRYEMLAHMILQNVKPWRSKVSMKKTERNNVISYKICQAVKK
jgi:hypothetical protein